MQPKLPSSPSPYIAIKGFWAPLPKDEKREREREREREMEKEEKNLASTKPSDLLLTKVLSVLLIQKRKRENLICCNSCI